MTPSPGLNKDRQGVSRSGFGVFNIFVPHQAPPSILNPFPIPPGSELGENPGILLSIILAIMLPAAGVLGLIVIFKMGKTKTKRN